MNITIPDEIVKQAHASSQELTEILAITLYKMNRINGHEGSKLLNTSESEFNKTVSRYENIVIYDEDVYQESDSFIGS